MEEFDRVPHRVNRVPQNNIWSGAPNLILILRGNSLHSLAAENGPMPVTFVLKQLGRFRVEPPTPSPVITHH